MKYRKIEIFTRINPRVTSDLKEDNKESDIIIDLLFKGH